MTFLDEHITEDTSGNTQITLYDRPDPDSDSLNYDTK
jgi:hypothetical protein